MNIKEAKQQIHNAVTAYLARNEYGEYEIPTEQQRPILLIGAPGIGKTAIMRQIAQEMGIGLVSYSMTHHTRQSALGLPRIEERPYGVVSEYTMSEIIAAVHDMMRLTGLREGILFLDEINCVSETLAPSMLQFLQYKTFGQHRVPEGWVIVTAGNPPEYNRAVRSFDIVTLDRLKRIQVEPDYAVWKEYAAGRQVHPAVMTYLEIRRDHFCLVESTPSGRQFVTPRGWEDLSAMLRLYEKKGLTADAQLIGQYLQHSRICADFASYYELFSRYSGDYAVEDILSGNPGAALERAGNARFDERYALLGQLLDRMTGELREVMVMQDALTALLPILKDIRARKDQPSGSLAAREAAARREKLARAMAGHTLPTDDQRAEIRLCAMLEDMQGAADFPALRQDFSARLERHKAAAARAGERLNNLFAFCEAAFPEGQEMLLLVTELTVTPWAARFIGLFGCERYFAHSRELLFHERHKEISEALNRLDMEDI
ncbi:MAG: ATP-binding protein [Aristaeellaceae bacterium]